MNNRLSRWLIPLGLALVLGTSSAVIVARERTLQQGRTVLLELGSFDPRSLMQGDYMALAFRVGNAIRQSPDGSPTGKAVVRLDAGNVATFQRFFRSGDPLAPDEVVLRYRIRKRGVRIGTDAYFFEEGSGPAFARARYGEFRVSDSGEAVLVALLDGQKNALGTARR